MNELMRQILFLPEQRSTVAAEIDYLHYFVITVTMVGAVSIALVTAFFIFRYARPQQPGEHQRHPGDARWTAPLWFELVVIIGLLTLFLLWWVIGFRQFIRLQRAPEDAMEVYVMGKKWMWTFAYPDGSGTQDILYVPVGYPVRLIMSSRDVIHSFFVPEFRVKQDLVPGRVTTTWFEVTEPGVYPILCAEYCGTGHSVMRGQVVALPPQEFAQRLEQPGRQDVALRTHVPPDTAIAGEERFTLAQIGERVANKHGCLRCHTIDGTAHIGPTWARSYGSVVPLADGRTVIADEAYLTESMMDPLAKLHRGFPPVMPPYQGILSAAEVGALIEYIKTLRDVSVLPSPPPQPTEPDGTTTIELPVEHEHEHGHERGQGPGAAPGQEDAQ